MLRTKTSDGKILKTYHGRELKSCAENHHIPPRRKRNVKRSTEQDNNEMKGASGL